METNEQPKCPICEEPIANRPAPMESLLDGYTCQCSRCGTFRYENLALQSDAFRRQRYLVSAWIRRNQSDTSIPFVASGIPAGPEADKWFDNLQHAGFPSTVPEKLDTLLKAYAELSKDHISDSVQTYNTPFLIAEIAARDSSELSELNNLLSQLNYISFSYGTTVRMLADGWKRVDQISRSQPESDSAFVAMWFDESTRGYREAVQKALEACGYKSLIVDQTEFNGFIIDEVVALIRQSRFVVADFTCEPEQDEEGQVKRGVRGGVYWEAGLAYGMGKQVIHTCQDCDDRRKRIHFDVAQYRTLFWKPEDLSPIVRPLDNTITNPNLAERLAQRILGTIGKGTFAGFFPQ